MSEKQPEQFPLPFADDDAICKIARAYGAPLYVHEENTYRRYAREATSAPNAFGLTVRYAMKANSHRVVLRLMDGMGVHIDASSYWEVLRALDAGIPPENIQITSQEVQPWERLRAIVEQGVLYNATSLEQVRTFIESFPGGQFPLGIRVNPGLGSGHNKRTNTGGESASFGIWGEYLDEVKRMAAEAGVRIERLHTHVGSGSDWKVWQKAARMTLDIAGELPDVSIVNLGGGYKIHRTDPEQSIDLQLAFKPVKEAFEEFARETGRRLHMEIEPGSYLAANSSILVAEVVDVVDTGPQGYRFIKINASMTELLRPMIYGAQHPIRVVSRQGSELAPFVVVGLCCESGDLFTPADGDPEEIATRDLPAEVRRGDIVAVMGAGAYGLAMSSKNYNSRPICAEAMIAGDGSHRLISRRQEPEEIWARELD